MKLQATTRLAKLLDNNGGKMLVYACGQPVDETKWISKQPVKTCAEAILVFDELCGMALDPRVVLEIDDEDRKRINVAVKEAAVRLAQHVLELEEAKEKEVKEAKEKLPVAEAKL